MNIVTRVYRRIIPSRGKVIYDKSTSVSIRIPVFEIVVYRVVLKTHAHTAINEKTRKIQRFSDVKLNQLCLFVI